MRDRENPQPTPDDSQPRIVSVSHPALPGPQYFRLPNFGTAGWVVEHFDHDLLVRTVSNDGTDLQQQLSESLKLAADCAALMGVCWQHPTSELDTASLPYCEHLDTWRRYGSDVGEELEDAGYSMIGVIACGAAIWGALFDRVTAVGTAAQDQAADFSGGMAPSTGP